MWSVIRPRSSDPEARALDSSMSVPQILTGDPGDCCEIWKLRNNLMPASLPGFCVYSIRDFAQIVLENRPSQCVCLFRILNELV